MMTAGLETLKGKLTSDVLFFQLHLLLQVRQQRLAPLSDGEGDRVEVVTGGLQGQSVQRQEAHHGLAARERAERHTREYSSGENMEEKDRFRGK